jgi:hypothetical protein
MLRNQNRLLQPQLKYSIGRQVTDVLSHGSSLWFRALTADDAVLPINRLIPSSSQGIR